MQEINKLNQVLTENASNKLKEKLLTVLCVQYISYITETKVSQLFMRAEKGNRSSITSNTSKASFASSLPVLSSDIEK